MVAAALRRLQHQRRLQRGPRYQRPCALAHRLLHRHRALFRRHPPCRPQALQVKQSKNESYLARMLK
ncbi:unnamed protein product [Ectocarpus sp. 6 AP-2014]